MAINAIPVQNEPAAGSHLAQTGNASNPSPATGGTRPDDTQLLPKEAEKYLREGGNIEDEPDPADAQEMEDEMAKNKKPENGSGY